MNGNTNNNYVSDKNVSDNSISDVIHAKLEEYSSQEKLFSDKIDAVVFMKEFDGMDDKRFIERAYFRILGRDADEEGLLMHLELLKSGKASKEDIVMGLANSEEGKKRRVKIKGLQKARALKQFVVGILD